MENLITRHRSLTLLAVVLVAQILGLAIQVRRAAEGQSTRLIRVWAVSTITPPGRALLRVQQGIYNVWHNYLYLRGVRQENRDLKAEIERLRLEQVRLGEDAAQARRLQALLAFKEQFVAQTVAAQVVGSSGSEQSRSVFIDKGEKDGLARDMAVITSDGVVGKILQAYPRTSQVLLINDQTSGLGAILERSRLQGIVRGSPSGGTMLEKVMSDEQVQTGERVLTSGGDGIFPKGLAVGSVSKAEPGRDLFLSIQLKPAANLSRLEEVLVITKVDSRGPSSSETAGAVRTVDILASRLPGVPNKPAAEIADPAKSPAGTATPTQPVPTSTPAPSGAPKPGPQTEKPTPPAPKQPPVAPVKKPVAAPRSVPTNLKTEGQPQ